MHRGAEVLAVETVMNPIPGITASEIGHQDVATAMGGTKVINLTLSEPIIKKSRVIPTNDQIGVVNQGPKIHSSNPATVTEAVEEGKEDGETITIINQLFVCDIWQSSSYIVY